ncbi:MAG: nucleotide exchange factor GrpE [Oscillibacter sp.]|jgi:molecular chaperone GrpE|nr:nucleotide exchange factor GrpE [Oscillibacter sp.]
MSEEKKNPENQPVNGETQAGSEAAAAEKEAKKAAESSEKSEKAEKGKKESKKKEKTFTLTREQMESAELAAKQLEAVKDQYTRLTAEYDNYRKRTAKEKEGIYQDAKIDTIKEFLAVYDNLERALATDADLESPHRKGLEMIFNQYKEILKKLGVTEMDAKGQPFDPNQHNAVMHIDDESLGENVVADVFQAGFMLGDKVLRFATVRVAN